MSRRSSWAHARADWSDGTVREGWLRVGDGTEFTAAVAAEVAGRLLRGEGRPGAHTPGALFGPELAEAVGGEFIRTPANAAAWLGAKRAELAVGPAPYTHPRKGEIVVRNHAVAVNPVDWITQLVGQLISPWIKYPFVIGSDLAGEVVEVGPAVARFSVGDRVLAHAVGADRKRNRSAEGAFQDHTVVLARMAAPIPGALPCEHAAVLPLGLSTAACALFQEDQLALQHPSATPEPTGETLLVWGGSTSVGSNAIQLAVAAGYQVITTSSPRNFAYVEKLGASQVFDYRSATAVDDVIEAFRGSRIAGALAIGTGSAEACADVVHACDGNKFVSMTSTAVAFDTLSRDRGLSAQLPRLVLRLVSSTVSLQVKLRRRRIRAKSVYGTTLMDNEVSTVIYSDFLPRALAEGRFVAAPDPVVVGKGLECIQAGLDAQKLGVSTQKVVISL